MKQTLTDLLKNALKPLGSTLYVWGGGWNEEDTGAGIEARTLGISPAWKAWFDRMGRSDYDYQSHRFRIHDGLDCSGYVGWCVYNTLEHENGKDGYVSFACDMAKDFARRGLGVLLPERRDVFARPGDIVSTKPHIYISLGMSRDGSQLLLHASPPALTLSGTSKDGDETYATALAAAFLKTHYPDQFSRFPCKICSHDAYTKDAAVFRFSEEILPDPDGVREMTPEQVVSFLPSLIS